MVTISLETHPIWDEFDGLLTQIDAESLAREHLEECQYQIEGYWDDDQFYERIQLSHSLDLTLESSSLSTTTNGHKKDCFVKLNFLLGQDNQEFGKLGLIFNSKMEFIDENWSIDVDSPFVVAKCKKHKIVEVA